MPKLTIDIEARLAKFQDSLDSVSRHAQRSARQIEGAFGSLRSLVAGALGGVALAASVRSMRELADAADAVGKRAQGLGIGAEALQTLQYAAQQSGVEAEQLDRALGKLAVGIADFQAGTGEAKDALAALGFSARDFAGLALDQQFLAVADRIAKLGDSGNKTALVMKVFGERIGRQLIPYLNEGADGIARLQAEARQLGGIFSDQLVEASTRFNDNLDRLARTATNFKIQALGPLIADLADLTDIFARAATAALSFGEKLKLAFSGDINLGRFHELVQEQERLAARLAEGPKEGLLGPIADFFERGSAEKRLREINAEKAEIDKLMQARSALAREVSRPPPRQAAAAPIAFNTEKLRAAARALASLEEARAKAAVASEQKLATIRLDLLDRFHAEGLIGEQDYWDRRLEIQRAAIQASISATEREIALRQEAVAKAPKGTADYLVALKELEDAQRRRNDLEQDLGVISTKNYLDAEKAAKEYSDEVTRTYAEQLRLQGRVAEATAQEIELQQRAARTRALAQGDTAQVIRLDEIRKATIARSAFNEVEQRGQDILRDLAAEEERIQNSRRVGATTELESLARTSAARQKAVEDLKAISAELGSIAAGSKIPELERQAADFELQMESLAATSDLLADKFDSIGESALGQLFDDVISGSKSAKEAIEDFGKSVVSEINKLIAQELGRKLYGSLFEAFGGGGTSIGGMLGGLFTGKGLGGLFGDGASAGLSGSGLSAGFFESSGIDLIPGFQHGGSFMVRGMGSADSQLVAFRATPGEHVRITPPGKSSSVANNITVNVNAGGMGGGGASTSQVGMEIGLAVQRALRRNG